MTKAAQKRIFEKLGQEQIRTKQEKKVVSGSKPKSFFKKIFRR